MADLLVIQNKLTQEALKATGEMILSDTLAIFGGDNTKANTQAFNKAQTKFVFNVLGLIVIGFLTSRDQ